MKQLCFVSYNKKEIKVGKCCIEQAEDMIIDYLQKNKMREPILISYIFYETVTVIDFGSHWDFFELR